MVPTDSIKLEDTLSQSEVFVLPLLLYIVWQVAYLFFTEVLLYEMMENDPEMVTSMRLVTFKTNIRESEWRDIYV